ncbi:hypothetical protein [Legionella clemsonensis]|uniref:Uncharacterized protein n=1 Tax=Legionella clemsonensis TaxID=1867846 RepID=A0A222P3C7_9GAMM|nr:hypothetical protein [Legionella clemsonensis]ASQ46360.1 hypothetical protein clem_09045 [Legionella clemsonensis]
MKNTPEKYVGSGFYIKGDIDYLEKHPEGIAQGWNVIFIGLDEKSSPLFLAANEYKQRFIFTYHEMLSLLATGFNQFPDAHTNPLVYKFVEGRDMEGFKKGNQSAFDTSMIKLFITNLPEAMKRLHEFCDNAYVYLIRRAKDMIPSLTRLNLQLFIAHSFLTRVMIMTQYY